MPAIFKHTAIIALTLAACDPDALADADDGPAPADPEAPAASARKKPPVRDLTAAADEPSAVVQGWHHTWSQGNGAIDMGPAADRFCFLTAMQGRFEGPGERIHAYVQNDRWKLAGISQQTGVTAGATCIPLTYWGQSLTYDPEVTWDSLQSERNLGTATGRVCFLTMVGGDFEGYGEVVSIERSGPNWRLTGSGNPETWPTQAAARCITTGYVTAPTTWFAGDPPLPMADAHAWVCGLQMIRGKFEGSGERVFVANIGDVWHLTGHTQQGPLDARAICI